MIKKEKWGQSPFSRVVFLFLFLIMGTVPILSPQLVFAADSEQLTQKISETIMSPFCPGRTLSACPSGEAKNLRGKIVDWIDHGYSEQAVRNQLTMIYGKQVAGQPDFYGFGLMAWIVPGLFVLLGVLALAVYFKRLRPLCSESLECVETNIPQGLGAEKYHDLIQAELTNRLR